MLIACRYRAATCVALLLAALPLSGPSAAPSETAGEQIARGDQLYTQAKLGEAREAYRAALQAEPNHFVALCRLAQVESELGEDAKGEEQKQLVAAAVQHARAAVSAAPESAQGHAWLAATLGRQALKEGPKKRLALSREIKAEADRALGIDPNLARAYHVRAIWNRKVASLTAIERLAANAVLGGVPKGASMENAVRDLEKAVELEPGYVNHHLELGRTFMMLKRTAEARREMEKAAGLPPTSNPRDPIYQAEARDLLKRLPR
ncbi:MAG: hypothetical protein E6K73_13505 [Candidatus Eisenbacteria bacterium]|uniref:Regulator of microtubule dynamics protein 1 n=1 Tax=Eiseniibacteriota bacterium TaxID=2212470 RepID=A0A538S830_UNCEI|nr:MAG: hypothetical protein E6K73_13505 [Candidatus Eisenbacteria bacterium]